MQIKSVSFEKNSSWQNQNPNRWIGTVVYESPQGNCTIPLAPEVAEKLLTVLTPVIVEFSQRATTEIAEILTKQLADSTAPAIEA